MSSRGLPWCGNQPSRDVVHTCCHLLGKHHVRGMAGPPVISSSPASSTPSQLNTVHSQSFVMAPTASHLVGTSSRAHVGNVQLHGSESSAPYLQGTAHLHSASSWAQPSFQHFIRSSWIIISGHGSMLATKGIIMAVHRRIIHGHSSNIRAACPAHSAVSKTLFRRIKDYETHHTLR